VSVIRKPAIVDTSKSHATLGMLECVASVIKYKAFSVLKSVLQKTKTKSHLESTHATLVVKR